MHCDGLCSEWRLVKKDKVEEGVRIEVQSRTGIHLGLILDFELVLSMFTCH